MLSGGKQEGEKQLLAGLPQGIGRMMKENGRVVKDIEIGEQGALAHLLLLEAKLCRELQHPAWSGTDHVSKRGAKVADVPVD